MRGRELLAALTCDRAGCECKRAEQRGRGNVHCPAHNDPTPSLNITERDGKTLLRCYGGCSQQDVIAALRERGLWQAQERRDGPRETVYAIRDTEGRLVAYHVRVDYPDGS